ncbi:vWA domain-containing protein [Methanoregula sp.]|uniref:vWA domain-containing protein n=1 Tax=Methanoregula sp. TaxID=2052170 RepID=UPI003C752772
MAGFYNPVWLFGLLLIPVLSLLYGYVVRKKKQEALVFSSVAFARSALGNRQKTRRVHILFALALAALALLFIGLADPHIPVDQAKVGVNVVFAIDDSGSMQASDYLPTRLEAAKSAADLLIRNLEPVDNAGIVVFESGATTAAYLSPDKDRVRQKLAAITPKPGQTAIGDGLSLAIDMAQSIPDRKSVIILISDGESNAGMVTVDEAVAAAQDAHIPVFTVGLGSPQPVVIGYDWLGNPEYAGLDEATLKSIAEKTGGSYFKSVDSKTLSDIYAGINQEIVREPVETRIGDWFIAGALLLLLTELILRYGRGRILP